VKGTDQFPLDRVHGSLVTVGTFDGIHRGHQEIFRRVMAEASKNRLEPVLVTFHPHPRVVVSPGDIPLLLTAIEEKLAILPNFFDGTVLLLEFNSELQNLSAEEFVRDILVAKTNVKKLMVGYDHAVGKNRGGNIVELTRFGTTYGFEVDVVGPITVDNRPVSSTLIRSALREGRFSQALRMLGHNYLITGIVEKGIGLGQKIGYPTANIRYSPRKLLPVAGVYACRAELDGERFQGMMFVGQNHFNPQQRISVEVNLFDCEQDIYGREMTVFPTEFVRHNQRFGSTDLLVRQIEKDKIVILNMLSEEKNDARDQRAKSSDRC